MQQPHTQALTIVLRHNILEVSLGCQIQEKELRNIITSDVIQVLIIYIHKCLADRLAIMEPRLATYQNIICPLSEASGYVTTVFSPLFDWLS